MNLRPVALLCAVALVSSVFAAEHRFHGNGFAVAEGNLSTIGSVALSPVGGGGSNIVLDYDDGMVRFAEAVSTVRGDSNRARATTVVTIDIRDISIGGRVHIDRLVTKITCRHPHDAPEANISFEGTEVQNLTVDGVPQTVALDLASYDALPTFALLTASGVVPKQGVVYDQIGNSVEVEGLGTLHFGEVLIKHGWRQMNLLRVDLKAERADGDRFLIRADDGSASPKKIVLASGEGNGTPIWP